MTLSLSIDLQLKKSIEALLFVHDHPISTGEFLRIFGKSADKEQVESCLELIARELSLSDKPFSLENIAGGWQMLTRPEYDDLIKKLVEVKKQETLSRAQLETLAVVAYTQPVTKSEVESVRGVGCGPVLKNLFDRNYITVVGRANRLGSPTLYGTGKAFLELFGMKDLSELPEREDILKLFRDKLGQAVESDPQAAEKRNLEDHA